MSSWTMGAPGPFAYGDAVRLGERLRSLRERAGLSLSQAGSRAGIHPNHWSDYERGERKDPKLSTLRRMASALDVELSELLTYVDDEP